MRSISIILFAVLAQAYAEESAAKEEPAKTTDDDTEVQDHMDNLSQLIDKLFQVPNQKDGDAQTDSLTDLFTKMAQGHAEELQKLMPNNTDESKGSMDQLLQSLFQGQTDENQTAALDDTYSKLVDQLFDKDQLEEMKKNNPFNKMVNELFEAHSAELDEIKKAHPEMKEEDIMDNLVDKMSDKLIDRAFSAMPSAEDLNLDGLKDLFSNPSAGGLNSDLDSSTMGKPQAGNLDVPFPNPADRQSPQYDGDDQSAVMAMSALADAAVAAAAAVQQAAADCETAQAQQPIHKESIDLAEQPTEQFSSPDYSIPAAALIAFFVGSGITFFTLRKRI